MPDITRDFIRTVGKHFVTLSCVQIVEGKRNPLVFSGFLVDAAGAWLFVTAGHILRDIKRALEAGSEFDVWRLDDQTARFDNPMPPVPYDFDINKWLVVEDDEIGLDYAVLPLEEYYIRHIDAAGGEPIRENAWGDHTQDHDYWVLMGMPSESVSYDGITLLSAKFAVIPLKATDVVPSGAGKKAENQFYADLDQMGNVTDLDGMSGGPIFSLKKIDENWIYHVIGVQSAWYSKSKVTAACPIKSLLIEIRDLVESVRDEAT